MSTAIIDRHRLLALLMSEWTTQQGGIGLQLHLRVQRLWRILPEDCSLADLKHILCPLFATSAQHQKDFQQIFDKVLFLLGPIATPAENANTEPASDMTSAPVTLEKTEDSVLPVKGQEPSTDYTAPRQRNPWVIELDNLDKYNQPPFTWNILPDTIGDPAAVDLGEDFGQTLLRLRRREIMAHPILNLPDTVQATIRQAGLPSIKYRYRSRPPEYLLLVERYSQNDHRSGLFDFFFQSLRANAVFVERFFYGGDLRICRNERHPGGLTLPELRQRYPTSRLIVLGAGYKMISSRTGLLADWTTPLHGWPVRVLLTPTPQPQWGRRENLLHKIFTILPASVQSLQYVAESPDSMAVQYEALPDYIRLIAEVQPIALEDPLIRSLHKHFDPQMTCWIAACAIYPALHYSLTLHIGRLLSESLGNRNLVTADNLLALSRLPWFVEGHIPKPHRDELIGFFSHRFPKEHVAVLSDLQTILEDERNQPPGESAAWLDHRINLAMIRMETKAQPDIEDVNLMRAVVKRLDRPEQLGDLLAPRRWEEVLERLDNYKPDIKEQAVRLLMQLLCPPGGKSILPEEGLAVQQEWARNWLFKGDEITPLVLDSAESDVLKYKVLEVKVNKLLHTKTFSLEIRGLINKNNSLLKDSTFSSEDNIVFNRNSSIGIINMMHIGDSINIGNSITNYYSPTPIIIFKPEELKLIEAVSDELIEFADINSSTISSDLYLFYGLFDFIKRKQESGTGISTTSVSKLIGIIERLIDHLHKLMEPVTNTEIIDIAKHISRLWLIHDIVVKLTDSEIIEKQPQANQTSEEAIIASPIYLPTYPPQHITGEDTKNKISLPYEGKKVLLIGIDKSYRRQIANMLDGVGFDVAKDDIVTKSNIEEVDLVLLLTLDTTLQKLTTQNIRRRDKEVPIILTHQRYPYERNKTFDNNHIHVLLGSIQPDNMASVLNDIFAKKNKSTKSSLYENIFARIPGERNKKRPLPLICSRCNEMRQDLSKCNRPACDFEAYRDRMLDVFGNKIPSKYYISLLGGVNASKTTYLLTLVDILLHNAATKKVLKKLGIDDVLIIDPNTWDYFNTKLNQVKVGNLPLNLPDEPLEFINLILYLSKGEPIEITIFNTSGEKIEDAFLDADYRTEAHDLKGIGSLYFVDPREDSKLNALLRDPKDASYGTCKNFDIITYIHRVMQFVNRGVAIVDNPTAICVSKFDLLMHRIPYDLPDLPFVAIEEKSFFSKINTVSKYLSQFLSHNSTTINPTELNSQFRNLRYFAIAPHGNDEVPAYWSKRNPKGILAPFLWILKELKIIPE